MRIAITLLALASLACAADVKDFSKTVPLDARGRFSLDTYKGSIHIDAWDRPEAEIQAHIETDPSGWRPMPADEVNIRLDASPGSVRVKTDYPHPFNEGTLPLVRYNIHIPRRANLTVKDYKSESQISGIQGDVEFQTYKGTARIEGIQGALNLDTYKGDIRTTFARFSAASRVNTYKGTIDMSLPRASAFELRTSLGRRAGFDCDFARTIHSVHRQEEIDGEVNGGGPALRVGSYRGEIRVRGI